MKKKNRIKQLEEKVRELENEIKYLKIMQPIDGVGKVPANPYEPYKPYNPIYPYSPYQPSRTTPTWWESDEYGTWIVNHYKR